MNYQHQAVMLKEVLEYLKPQIGEIFVDGTLGGGGYTEALAQAVGSKGKIISFDLDPLAINNFKNKQVGKNLNNVFLINDNFANFPEALADLKIKAIDGLVLDLGLSSAQLADETRGFSFNSIGDLDMSFGPESTQSTGEIVNRYSEAELARIFKDYGEEKFSGRIARCIVEARRRQKITRVEDLVKIIIEAIPNKFRHSRIHPATRVFQALRIETNEELENLKRALKSATRLLKSDGRLVIVSFHSLEDRIVKQFLKNNLDFKILTKKPIIPAEAEITANARARSAKLRAASKI